MKEFFYKYSNHENLIAIRTSEQTISYKELFDKAKKISSKIPQSISGNKYIPIISASSIEFVVIVLALWEKGLVPVPLNIKWTDIEIKKTIKQHNFDLIFYEAKFFDLINGIKANKISFNELFSSDNLDSKKISNDEAVVIFTSGSTGEAKGVIHTFNSLANSIINGSKILNQNVGDRWLASLPFYHIGGFQIICRALSNGCEIIIPNNIETESLKISIEEFHPTHISLVSTQLKRLIEANTHLSAPLKLTLIGGGFSEDDLLVKADNSGWKIFRVYGSSETASFISAASVNEIINNPNTVGKPVKNVDIKISENDEILVSTNSLFKAYLNNLKETNAKLKDGFYHTGDIGKLQDGYLFIEARRNDLIVTGGENVNPYEIEKALLKIEGIIDACVFGLNDKIWGQKVCAAVVTNNNIKKDYIKYYLAKELSSFKIPKEIYFVDEIPRTLLGKIEREKLKAKFE